MLVFVIFFTRCRHLLPDTLPNGEQFATPVCEALQALEGPLAYVSMLGGAIFLVWEMEGFSTERCCALQQV